MGTSQWMFKWLGSPPPFTSHEKANGHAWGPGVRKTTHGFKKPHPPSFRKNQPKSSKLAEGNQPRSMVKSALVTDVPSEFQVAIPPAKSMGDGSPRTPGPRTFPPTSGNNQGLMKTMGFFPFFSRPFFKANPKKNPKRSTLRIPPYLGWFWWSKYQASRGSP